MCFADSDPDPEDEGKQRNAVLLGILAWFKISSVLVCSVEVKDTFIVH